MSTGAAPGPWSGLPVCDGCQVAGFGPHECSGSSLPVASCRCQVYRSCANWQDAAFHPFSLLPSPWRPW